MIRYYKEFLPFLKRELLIKEAQRDTLRELKSFYIRKSKEVLYCHSELNPVVLGYLKQEREIYKRASSNKTKHKEYHSYRLEYIEELIKVVKE